MRSIAEGVAVPLGAGCCGDEWVIAPDGIAYGVSWPVDDDPSQMMAIDHEGVRPGWPVEIDGSVSLPTFTDSGRAIVTVGSTLRARTLVYLYEDDISAGPAWGQPLPMRTVEPQGNMGCTSGTPLPPILAADGTMIVVSELDTSVYAVAGSLDIVKGWPFEPATPIERLRPGYETEREAGFCPAMATPAIRTRWHGLPRIAGSESIGRGEHRRGRAERPGPCRLAGRAQPRGQRDLVDHRRR